MVYTRVEVDNMLPYSSAEDEDIMMKQLDNGRVCLDCQASVRAYKSVYDQQFYNNGVSMYCRFYKQWVGHYDNCKRTRKELQRIRRWQNGIKKQGISKSKPDQSSKVTENQKKQREAKQVN